MSTLIFILIAAGIVYLVLFHKPHNDSVTELQKWFSSQLSGIAANIEYDIEKDNNGEYPHAGKQSFDKRGKIVYLLRDKDYARFDVSDKNAISSQDIMATDGYRELLAKAQELDLSIRLEEINVEGDDVQSFHQLDEYIDDFPRYYTVTISGW